MKRLRAIWLRLIRGVPPKGDPGRSTLPRFGLVPLKKGVLLFRAFADQPRMTQMALDLIRNFPSPMGLVLVEYQPDPREWLSSYLGRRRTLAALLKIRDLLGSPELDLAVVSPPLGAEVIIDRFGILEVRTGTWNEGVIRSAFLKAGFKETHEKELEQYYGPLDVNPASQERIGELIHELRLKPALPEG